jgi:nucleolar protein 58
LHAETDIFRTNATTTDLSEHVTEDIEAEIKKTSEISMGTEISEEDILNIQYLCTQITTISDYRSQLYEYLRNRMNAIAPNLTILVGELVGARLIAHAGSLINLAKYPSSTVQILGAEKALFRWGLVERSQNNDMHTGKYLGFNSVVYFYLSFSF